MTTQPPADLFDGADPVLAAELRQGLDRVEQRLLEIADASSPMLQAAATHLAEAGGKRLRPLLALLAAQFGDPAAAEAVEAALVVELTHLGSLYHDDVMDEAPVRRGAPSANARWTNTVAILTGDYLFARASDVVAGLGTEAVHIQARTFARLVDGQIAETAGPQDGEDPVEHHLQVVADKTASLIAASARLGALVTGAPRDRVEVLARYGEAVGVAFQLSDDLIDVLSESWQSGKTPGHGPARGHPDAAGPAGAGRGRRGGRAAARAGGASAARRRRARRGVGAAARLARARRRPGPGSSSTSTRRGPSRSSCRPERPGTPWSGWPTTSWPVRAEPVPLSAAAPSGPALPDPVRMVVRAGRRYRLSVYGVGLACCAVELVAAAARELAADDRPADDRPGDDRPGDDRPGDDRRRPPRRRPPRRRWRRRRR